MTGQPVSSQANGSQFAVFAPNSENTVGLVFVFTITLLLLFALLRSMRRERQLLAQLAQQDA